MKLKFLAFALSLFLLISVGLNVLLVSRSNIYFSYEKLDEPEVAAVTDQQLGAEVTTAPSPTPTEHPINSGDLNKQVSVPIKDSDDKVITELLYEPTRYEFTNEVTVQGKTARAIEGREFLIINIKITNNHEEIIKINTRDYIRLSINDNTNEWLSPDIHNDPTEVQPNSSKLTRVGFAVNTADDIFTIRLGGTDQEKLFIDL